MSRKLVLVMTSLTIVLIGMLTLSFNIQPVKAIGTIYIRADGSVEPSTVPIQRKGNLYTLTDNIIESVSGFSAIVIERDNMTLDGAGYTYQVEPVGLAGSTIFVNAKCNVTIRNIKTKWCIAGITLWHSSNCKICGNTLTDSTSDGIVVRSSSNNTVSENNIANNYNGIYIDSYSNYNTISGNNITNNRYGGIVLHSNFNSVSGNNVANNGDGIILAFSSSNNTISENNITANEHSIHLVGNVTSNSIYHNNLVDNTVQVGQQSNVWDDGYPSGGNYWSSYTGVDANGDGIGDTPYLINENNQDRYPLISPWSEIPVERGIAPRPFWIVWLFWAIAAVVIVALTGTVYFLKKRKPPKSTALPK